MPRNNYRALTIPAGLYNALRRYVATSNGRYVTINEVVRDALRTYLKRET